LNIWQLPAIELARLIRSGALSARDAVSAHLARIEAVNSRVNAIVTLTADKAMSDARLADERFARGDELGPLHGLPIAHKDLQDTAGIRTTYGSPIFQDHVPSRDSPLVARLKRAGAITIGKTNTPEFGAGSQTFNPVFGTTLNPYDLNKTCGGSSGGAAVALACGMMPIADGTDMGGSLRNPAAFCGVVGMRPSAGLMPDSEEQSWSSLSVDGPIARTTADVAMLLGAMVDRGASFQGDRLDRDFSGVRLSWPSRFGGLPFDPKVLDAVHSHRPLFESLGCFVDDVDADWDGIDGIFKTLRAHAFVAKHGDVVSANRGAVKDTILEEVDRGSRLTAEEVERAQRARVEKRASLARFMERYEFLILPTTQVPPFDASQPFVREIDGTPMASYIDWMKSCYYVSTVGHPAISIPCGLTTHGLPVGLQIVGRAHADSSVLQLAHAYEQARGPFPSPMAYKGKSRP
jgi:amidase